MPVCHKITMLALAPPQEDSPPPLAAFVPEDLCLIYQPDPEIYESEKDNCIGEPLVPGDRIPVRPLIHEFPATIVRNGRRYWALKYLYDLDLWTTMTAEWHGIYRQFFETVCARVPVLLAIGGCDPTPFHGFPLSDSAVSRFLADAPATLRGKRAPPMNEELIRKYGLRLDAIEKLSQEELTEVEACYNRPIDLLAANQASDLRGWLTYFGQPLVEHYGREKLLSGPFYRVEAGPRNGMLIQLEPGLTTDHPSREAWSHVASVEEAQRYLDIDDSYGHRFLSLSNLACTRLGMRRELSNV